MKQHVLVVSDPPTLLNPSEIQALSEYIPSKCLCTPKVLNQLELILVRDFGDVGWNGLWVGTEEEEEDDGVNIKFSGGIIALNVNALGSGADRLEALKKVLCHEYGHHWTLTYAFSQIEYPLNIRFPLPWYKCRNTSRNIAHYKLPDETSNYDGYCQEFCVKLSTIRF